MLTPDQNNVIAVDVLYDALSEAAESLDEAAGLLRDLKMMKAANHIQKAADAANTILEEYAGTPADEPEEIDNEAEIVV